MNFGKSHLIRSAIGCRRHLLAIENHLEEGETIVRSCWGFYATRIANENSGNNALFLVTEKRAILFGKNLFGYDITIFPFDEIKSAELIDLLYGSKLTINLGTSTAVLTLFGKSRLRDIVSFIQMQSRSNTPIKGTFPKLRRFYWNAP